MKRQKKNLFWILLLLILLMGVLFARPILHGVGNFLIVSDELKKADLITSVSGPDYRAIYAAELCQNHLAPHLFYTGGYNEFDQRYQAQWSKYLATRVGVAAGNISIDNATVISTYEEAKRVKKYIADHPKDKIKTIIVVTDPYHTRRTKWAYQKVLGDQVTVLTAPVPFEETGYSSSWWKTAATRQMVFQEYGKYIYYLFRYEWTSGRLQYWLAKFDRF